MLKPKLNLSEKIILAMIARREWKEIGEYFDFTPRFLPNSKGYPILDWDCIPQDLADALNFTHEGRARHKLKCLAGMATIKAEIHRNPPPPLKSRRLRLFVFQNGVCHYCKKNTPYEQWTVEHKQPRCRGGSNCLDNVVGACHYCNHTKGAMTELEFMEYLKP